MNEQSPKKFNKKWLTLINIPIQMGLIIFVFAYFGSWLDKNYPNKTFCFNKILLILGVGLALYNVIRQVNQINKTQ
jgi:uncharacterized membrane protein